MPEPADERRQLLGLARVHAGGRLVEQQQRRLRCRAPGRPRAGAGRRTAGSSRGRRRGPSARRARGSSAARSRASASSRRSRGVESIASTSCALSWVCIPTSTFSSAVMFWNRRMFWNVRPRPACDHVVGPGAPEDAEAGPSRSLVPRRPRRRRRASRSSGRARSARSPMMTDGRARGATNPGRSCRAPRSRRAATHRTGSSHDRRGRAIIRRPRERDLAAGRVEDAGDDVEERRLAGAVGPDQADDRALRDREVDVVDGDQAAEALRDVLGVEEQPRLMR